MSGIDIHTHAFPDKVAPRAIEHLETIAEWQAVGYGTVSGLLRSMDAADLDISAICYIATKPDQVKGKKVLVVEDGPTLTHGEMSYGAGTLAA